MIEDTTAAIDFISRNKYVLQIYGFLHVLTFVLIVLVVRALFHLRHTHEQKLTQTKEKVWRELEKIEKKLMDRMTQMSNTMESKFSDVTKTMENKFSEVTNLLVKIVTKDKSN